MQDFRHRRTRHINTLLGQPALMKIFSGMFTVRQVHIRNNIHDPAVGLLRQTFILTPVSCFHVKDRDMQAFCRDG